MLFFVNLLIWFYIVYLVISIIFLILDNRKTASTYAWIFLFIIFPVIGLLIYMFFGKSHRILGTKRKQIEHAILKNFSELLEPLFEDHAIVKTAILNEQRSCDKIKLINLLEKNSFSLLSPNNEVKIIQEGEEKFSLLMTDLQAAKNFIHMAYFIWHDDDLTQQIKNILIDKANEGVEVRILIDAIGSFSLPSKYKNQLRDNGVEIYRYFDFNSFFTIHTVNHRNHRKIVIIDGFISYTGGMNMGKEYICGDFGYDCWRDTHLRIRGEGVKSLQAVFVLEWENTTKVKLYGKNYFPDVKIVKGNSIMQLAVSGPDSQWDSVKQMYFTMICSARTNIFIQTPYFVPDEGLCDALKIASLSGVDVRIMITGVPDKKIPYWAAFTFFEELIDSGVKILHYNRCFLHSKTIVIDSELCSVGTANFDIRSFIINYELMAVFYDEQLSKQLESDFKKDLLHCSVLSKEKYSEISTVKKFRNSVARLLSPQL